MTHLDVYLLLNFRAKVDHVLVEGFKSAKARALLAYLAIEIGRPLARSSLAALLWPDLSEEAALSNLRSVLANLRKILERNTGQTTPFLQVDHQSIQLNPAFVTCDVTAFKEHVQAGRFKEAVALYQGRLLQEFYSGSAAFDDWQQINAEALHREVMQTLSSLIRKNQQTGNLEQCLHYAQQRVNLDPIDEESHQILAYLLALNAQRVAGLNQIDFCRQILAKDLGVNLSSDMVALEKAIKNRQDLPIPRGLTFGGQAALSSTTSGLHTFVAREPEIRFLKAHLIDALNGHGKMIFVNGDSGCGKSSLVEAFVNQVSIQYPELLILSGECAFYGGIPPTYLPFREMGLQLTRLTEGYGRYKRARTESIQPSLHSIATILKIVNEAAPDLGLLLKASLKQLEDPPIRDQDPVTQAVQQIAIYQQAANLIEKLSRRFPLLFVIDDLQWADRESLNLLIHLSQRLSGSTALFIGIYRTNEMSIAPDSQTYPLEFCVNELVRIYGDIILDLNQSDGKAFVEAYLNTFPNRFSAEFRKTLFRRTGGHALFTVDLVENLQKMGFIKQDQQGNWVDSRPIDWRKIPKRVEAIITQRFKKLPMFWQNALVAASVEGELFTGEVLAQVMESKPSAIIQGLSRTVGRQHGLVDLEEIRVNSTSGRRATIFRFRHAIYQEYLYLRMDAAERSILHEAIGTALEQIYGEKDSKLAPIAPQLAYHFDQAGSTARAASYYFQAGRTAVYISADQAMKYLQRACDLLDQAPQEEENDRLRLNILMELSTVTRAIYGWGCQERFKVLEDARQLALQLGDLSKQRFIHSQLIDNYLGSGQVQMVVEKSQELAILAEQAGQTSFVWLARLLQSEALILQGRFGEGVEMMEDVLAYQEAHRDDPLFYPDNPNEQIARVLYQQALLLTGFPQQAQAQLDLLLNIARRSQSPLGLGLALTGGGIVQSIFLENVTGVIAFTAELQAFTAETAYQVLQPWVKFFIGWQEFQDGQWQMGMQKLMEWVNTWGPNTIAMGYPFLIRTLADVMRMAGRPTEGEKLLRQLLNTIRAGQGSNHMMPDMIRLLGECQLACGDEAAAEASFREAIDMARENGARLFQLNAASSLCRLKLRQGAPDQAAEMLKQIYGTFSEGFDTIPLRTANQLISAAGKQIQSRV